jgi:hypothetical protein
VLRINTGDDFVNTGDEFAHLMRSSTLWTSRFDSKNLIMYYHTQNNRRVRRVDLKKILAAGGTGIELVAPAV